MEISSAQKLIRKCFFICAMVMFIVSIVFPYITQYFMMDFLLKHTNIINTSATLIYLIIFIPFIYCFLKLKETVIIRNLLIMWGHLFLIIFLQNLYILIESQTNFSASFVITGIPIDIICTSIGTSFTYLLVKQSSFKKLTLFNFIILVILVCSPLLSINNIIRILIKQITQHGIVTIINLLTISFSLKIRLYDK